MNTFSIDACVATLWDVFDERLRQVATYGTNDDLANGTGGCWLLPYTSDSATQIEATLRDDYEDYKSDTGGPPTWTHLVREEIAEAFQETDPGRLEEELIQVAALCVSWVETLRKTTQRSDTPLGGSGLVGHPGSARPNGEERQALHQAIPKP